MRQRHKDHRSFPVLKFMGAALIASMSGACSSDILRFNDSPFANPFSGRADTATTGSVNAPLQKVRASSLGMPRPAVSSQPFPGAVASSNPVTAVSQVAAGGNSPITGGVAGWSSAGGTPVTLGSGDTIEALSGRYGVPTSALRQINGLSGNAQPSAGQQLIIPAYNPGASAKKAATAAVAQPIKSSAPRYESLAQTAPVRAAAAPVAKAPRYLPVEQDDTTAKVLPRLAKSAPKPVQKALPKSAQDDDDDETPTASVKPVKTVKIAPKASAKTADDDEDDVPAVPQKRPVSSSGFQPVDKAKPVQARPVAAVQPKAAAKPKAAPQAADQDDDEDDKPVAKTAVAPKVTPAAKAEPVKAAKVETPKAVAVAPKAADQEVTGSVNNTQEFRWPARGRVISGYGSKGPSGANDGINISLPEGTPVKAAEGGTVAYAGEEIKGYGKMVLIRHPNGYVSAYAHNGDVNVKRGETVKRGQVIAKSGQTGNVTSPQLHFELRKGSETVDPSKFLEGN